MFKQWPNFNVPWVWMIEIDDWVLRKIIAPSFASSLQNRNVWDPTIRSEPWFLDIAIRFNSKWQSNPLTNRFDPGHNVHWFEYIEDQRKNYWNQLFTCLFWTKFQFSNVKNIAWLWQQRNTNHYYNHSNYSSYLKKCKLPHRVSYGEVSLWYIISMITTILG